jgi:hypothetical protein
MRKLFFCLTLVFLSVFSFAQTAIQKRMLEVKQTIQKNIPLDANLYDGIKNEVFLIDIYLTPSKSISKIVILHEDSSIHIRFIRNVVEKIKAEWKPFKTNTERILIPVALIVTGRDKEDDFLLDLPLAISKAKAARIYLAKEITVNPGLPIR